ncbi:NTP transferase domain-containing protein [Streptomyces sp. NPDC015125]|uniref:phosphocholine cytidylyltransferase family protein n=1 Tax=Streptomyces sp. NPDC015125 TaxID=3364938 RepID=UPI0036F66882
MDALVLAAGEGTRLGRYAADRPKCLVELAGTSLLERSLRVLAAFPAVSATVVGGTRSGQLRPPADRVIVNERATSTNIVGSLCVGLDALGWPDDVLVVYGDIVFEQKVIAAALAPSDAACVLPVNTGWRELWQHRMPDPLADAETLLLSADGSRITRIGGRPAGYGDVQAQFMGVLRLRAEGIDWLRAMPAATRDQMDMTTLVDQMISAGPAVAAIPVAGGWLEVDTETDLELYRTLHADGQLDRLCRIAESGTDQ